MILSSIEFRDKLLHHKHLPKGLVVNGHLSLYGCTALTHLPEGLVVNGNLSLYGCTALAHLPEGLKVNGFLDLYDCTALIHLPEGLKVGGTIYCNKSLINSIPKEDLPLYINYNFEKDVHEYISSKIKGAKHAKVYRKH
jgi:hypothetical protein